MGSKGQQVDLMSLDVPQLLEVKKQLETEVQHLTSSFGQLKAAQAKFRSCIDSVATIKPENKDKTTLIPLTSSLYVPGKLSDLENVIVDVGTGYYVEKSTSDATKMYQEKVEFLTKNLEQLQETVLRQQENLQTTVEMIRLANFNTPRLQLTAVKSSDPIAALGFIHTARKQSTPLDFLVPPHTASMTDGRTQVMATSAEPGSIETFVHDPPFAKAKVKRLRRVHNAHPRDPFGASPDMKAPTSASSQDPIPTGHDRTSDAITGSHLHPPCVTNLGEQPPPLRSTHRLDPSLLLEYLTTSGTEAKHRIKSQLPSGLLLIDAYLLLRDSHPESLSALSTPNIYSLIRHAGRESLGGVLSLLLQDVVGPELNNPNGPPGLFQVKAGTQDRYRLLREILARCTQSNFLIHDGNILNIFTLILHDLCQIRQTDTDTSSASTIDRAYADGDSGSVQIPDTFPTGEARRLVKLALQFDRPELGPIVKALRVHLETRNPTFPTAREGAQLIAYYLQPNLRDFESGLDVVRALRDTNALAQDVIDDAVHDGRQYFDALQSAFSSVPDDAHASPSQEELEKVCLDVSLRIVGMKCLMAQRPDGGVQYRMTLESLLSSFRFDLVDSCQEIPGCDLRSLLDVPVNNIRTIIKNLLQSQNDPLSEVLSVLQRCDPRIVAMLPNTDLQEICDVGRDLETLRQATEIYALFVKAKTTARLPLQARHILARDGCLTNAEMFLILMRVLLDRGQKVGIVANLRALGVLPLTEAAVRQLNLRFTPAQRASLITLLAKAGATDDAFLLFQHWSQCRYEEGLDFDSARSVAAKFRGPDSIQVGDALMERQIRLMHESDRQVAISASCVVALVRSLCSNRRSGDADASPASETQAASEVPKGSTEEQLRRARFVIDAFVQSCTSVDWTHYRLTALAQACFLVRDVPGAFYALAQISFLRQLPDKLDITVLLGGLMHVDPDRAVRLFIQHASVPKTLTARAKQNTDAFDAEPASQTESRTHRSATLPPMKASPTLVSMLINRAIVQGRMDLADRLYKFGEMTGIKNLPGHVASIRALFLPDVAPNAVVKAIDRAHETGWKSDPGLLESLSQRLLRRAVERIGAPGEVSKQLGVGGKGGRERFALPPLKRLDLAKAAATLMRMSAQSMDVVNLKSVHLALEAINSVKTSFARPNAKTTVSSSTARQRDPEKDRLQWIGILDELVHRLRWATFFDTGNDYRHSLPLWKSSKARDGQLIPAELDDMMTLGFEGRGRKRQAAGGRGASAPRLAEATDESQHGNDASSSEGGDVSKDAALQQPRASSPNVLPAILYRRLMEAYLALADAAGAAEVAAWMRDEAGMDIAESQRAATTFVSRIKAAVRDRESDTAHESDTSNILRMLAGQQGTATTKRWWTP
ncbi:hypothetical protein PaG_04988 [Moesziomyces aphidis]|uniref:Prefoldin subunit 5 n=1 Tax=Moesziomyces aphidis TaxID=84754 RepID=W3VHP0_MOEAP|nr:hypothetical protein PaG_04988 [Moesziomyces aphidis]